MTSTSEEIQEVLAQDIYSKSMIVFNRRGLVPFMDTGKLKSEMRFNLPQGGSGDNIEESLS